MRTEKSSKGELTDWLWSLAEYRTLRKQAISISVYFMYRTYSSSTDNLGVPYTLNAYIAKILTGRLPHRHRKPELQSIAEKEDIYRE